MIRVRLAAAAALITACSTAPKLTPSPMPVPGSAGSPIAPAQQLVVVTTADWDTTTGTLRRYERATADAAWRPVGAPAPIVTGRTGLAWGVGFDVVGDSPAAP